MTRNNQLTWEQYCRDELIALSALLEPRGYTLAEEQPHLGGERYLMQAVTTHSGRKLILYGQTADRAPVVIKATRESAGQAEINEERTRRNFLNQIDFAADAFSVPPELDYLEQDGFVVSVQACIEQTTTFLERSTPEQFDFVLRALNAQAGAHAATYKHRQAMAAIYGIRSTDEYLTNFTVSKDTVAAALPQATAIMSTLIEAGTILTDHRRTIEQYGSWLTHTDFVPHNWRIDEHNVMYLLDHSSFIFGNKYEGWARLVNFMTLYNPPLAKALEEYVANNRSEGEQQSLWLMRLYRLGELMAYYASTLERSEGNLKTLNRLRVDFWHSILTHVMNELEVPERLITDYQTKRDNLRSDSEKDRQKNLH